MSSVKKQIEELDLMDVTAREVTDVKRLETGVDYDKLPDMWTIWILPYDPFGMDYRMYTVKNVVEENPEIEYNDGIRKLFLYTGGKRGGTIKEQQTDRGEVYADAI